MASGETVHYLDLNFIFTVATEVLYRQINQGGYLGVNFVTAIS